MSDDTTKTAQEEKEAPKITRREKRWADLYLEGISGAEAVRRMGYKGPRPDMVAWRFKQRPAVKNYLAEQRAQAEYAHRVHKERVERTLYLLSVADIEELQKLNPLFKDVKVSDVTRAAEVLSKIMGWTKDRIEHSGSIETPTLQLVLNAPGTPRKAD